MKSKLETIRSNFYSQLTIPDLLIITETRFDGIVKDHDLGLVDYSIFRKDRSSKVRSGGGGVLIAVKSKYQAELINFQDDHSEHLFLKFPHHKIIVSVLYISPSSKEEPYYTHANLATELYEKFTDYKFFMIGDYNLSGITWSSDSPLQRFVTAKANKCDKDNSDVIVNAFAYMDLSQKLAALVSKGYSLDLLFTNLEEVDVSESNDSFLVLDKHHKAYEIKIKVIKCNNSSINVNKRNFFRANYDAISKALLEYDWNDILYTSDIDSMINKFYIVLNTLIERYIPLRSARARLFPDWFSHDLIYNILQKRFIHFLWKITYDNLLFIEFKRLRAVCKRETRTCYMQYINLIENNCRENPRAFYSFVNNKTAHNSLPSVMHLDDSHSDNINDTINLFAQFFHSSFSSSHISSRLLHDNDFANFDYTFSDSDIIKIVSELKDYGGKGPDGIPNVFVKNCIHSLLIPLRAIFQKSLSSHTFPNIWKLSHIIPIFKKGDKNNIKNYRPISMLSCFSKILESLFYYMLYSEVAPLISTNQHGFVKGLSTVTNLAVHTDYVAQALDQHKQVDTIYTDFSKAFDKVSHGILLDKLVDLNIDRGLILWIKSYLSDRSQCVTLNNTYSVSKSVVSGVPQGSKLGPLLFILYINDLALYIKFSLLLLYADDCKLSLIINSPFDSFKLQSDLSALEKWSETNLIPLNIPKCAVMHTYRCHSPYFYRYSINNIHLNKVTSYKDLGVIFNDNLNFSEHIDAVSSKCMRNFGWIRRQSKSFGQIDTIRCLFNSFVLPHLYYASSIWTPFRDLNIKKLEIINHQLIRYIAYKDGHPIHFFNHNYSLHSIYYNIPSIVSQHKLNDLILGFKLLKRSINHPQLSPKFKFRPKSQKVRIYRPITEYKASGDTYYYSFILRLTRLINELGLKIEISPDSIKVMSVESFRTAASPLTLEFYT